jgi:hypothetical protein
VEGVQFLSDTISARRPDGAPALPAYVLDLDLAKQACACACGTEPLIRHSTGCLVCGEPLVYLPTPVQAECQYCHRPLRTWARCAAGHYVCDQCHGGDYLRFVHSFVAQCELTDPVEILLRMKEAYPFPTHGPEHHTLVTAAFLAAYRNAGGEIDGQRIEGAITEGVTLPGGTCGYWGACAAALGMGIAYSAILGATPLTRRERAAAQAIVARILSRLSELDAPRCCRRESLIALQTGAECSGQFLPRTVRSSARGACRQPWLNAECIGAACPYSAEHERQGPRARRAMHEAG